MLTLIAGWILEPRNLASDLIMPPWGDEIENVSVQRVSQTWLCQQGNITLRLSFNLILRGL